MNTLYVRIGRSGGSVVYYGPAAGVRCTDASVRVDNGTTVDWFYRGSLDEVFIEWLPAL